MVEVVQSLEHSLAPRKPFMSQLVARVFQVALRLVGSMAVVQRAGPREPRALAVVQVISEPAFHFHPESLWLAAAEVEAPVLAQAVDQVVDLLARPVKTGKELVAKVARKLREVSAVFLTVKEPPVAKAIGE